MGVIDYYSRLLEDAILKSTTSAKIIEAITPMFARFSAPFSLRTEACALRRLCVITKELRDSSKIETLCFDTYGVDNLKVLFCQRNI